MNKLTAAQNRTIEYLRGGIKIAEVIPGELYVWLPGRITPIGYLTNKTIDAIINCGYAERIAPGNNNCPYTTIVFKASQ